MSLIDGLFTKYTPPENQVLIEINNLVPFNAFGEDSWERFQGRRLDEMIDRVRGRGVIQYITVRPMSAKKYDGKYEVLNGHYRVAAARYWAQRETVLGKAELYTTVPAIVLEGLSDEDALSYVSDTNPVGLYEKYGIDIAERNYRESASFQAMKNARVFPDGRLCMDLDEYVEQRSHQIGEPLSMALDEYIERYLLTKEEVEHTYPNNYSMGNPHELSDEECCDFAIALAIARDTEKADEMSMEDKAVLDELAKADAKELVKNFTCKGGYIDQLKNHTGIDLNSFCYDSLQNKRERAKILYFINRLRKKFPDTHVLQMLSKPSLENMDNSFFGLHTSNEKYIGFMLHEIEKEISTPLKENIKGAVWHIVDTWGGYMINWSDYIEDFYNQFSCIPSVVNRIKAALEEPYDGNSSFSYSFAAPTPLEALYLKVVQNPYLGEVRDILQILSIPFNADYPVPAEYINEMKKFEARKMCADDLDDYFSAENVRKITKYVYLEEITDKNVLKEKRRAIRDKKEHVRRFLDFLTFADPLGEYNIMDDVTELLIISCLQSIMLDKPNEIFNYSFHGVEGKNKEDDGKKRKGKIHVQVALKNDNHTYNALQIYWVHRVVDRSFANVGKVAVRKAVRELENSYLRMLEKALEAPDIQTMLSISSFYQQKWKSNI